MRERERGILLVGSRFTNGKGDTYFRDSRGTWAILLFQMTEADGTTGLTKKDY